MGRDGLCHWYTFTRGDGGSGSPTQKHLGEDCFVCFLSGCGCFDRIRSFLSCGMLVLGNVCCAYLVVGTSFGPINWRVIEFESVSLVVSAPSAGSALPVVGQTVVPFGHGSRHLMKNCPCDGARPHGLQYSRCNAFTKLLFPGHVLTYPLSSPSFFNPGKALDSAKGMIEILFFSRHLR